MARLALIGTAFVACSALAIVPLVKLHPVVLWNASSSVPIGLYLIEKRTPSTHEIAILRLPDWASTLADRRGYLPTSALLLKPVVARKGDIVCRFGRFVFVNGRLRSVAFQQDKMRRPLPSWRGCLKLDGGQILVLSKHEDSFDSRYFGPVEDHNVIGVGQLIFPPSK